MHVIADHGGDDAVPVDHSDVCTVGEIEDIIRGNGDTLGISELSITRERTVTAVSLVAGQTTFARTNHRLPVVIRIGVVVGIADTDDLMGFRIGYVEDAVQRA